ncbi:UDP-N-acetylmuramoyl-L-alanyl-D-glutamate--2,6-diaminopimelate ligase [Alkalibacter saccharofermentans]|uniref:UDP-N-acetylmuramoyl-L-alanyl-D-glutamate--2,6-diaminopimelate ligase n=1 Tax=Alkalibacter saccharofermentans DSM 14828 TaxID=1120975 RepID=A0A1M4UGW7_9FIRM|nr:UDP-N-acetylmuramoyl-L-alanyl-D-glutamate--2,6-diaminopimelate ligase [Alkalibacter saccharofermentans]SHE55915.1 UDP-N-acetylmuramoylalanyl-D-glutamate--2,6-diaminopimelate ligase [Alkalibacter saccharofermentans DSM 14828]
MKLSKILEKIDCQLMYGNADKDITGLEFDSRKCKPGDLFIAISGFESDGNNYIDEAISKGAVAVLSEKEPNSKVMNHAYLKVPNARKAMSKAAAVLNGDPSKRLKVIGITGTNGKTSTAYFLRSILEYWGKTTGIIGTLGNYCKGLELESEHTTPESVEIQRLLRAMEEQGAEYVVMEVSSHGLDLYRVEDVCFSGAVFTNLTQDHLDFHKTMESYFNAKKRLFDFEIGYGVVNTDDDYGLRLYKEKKNGKYKVTGYGLKAVADGKISGVSADDKGTTFVIDIDGKRLPCITNQIGGFNVYNLSAAILAARNEGMPEDGILECIKEIKGVPGRLERIDVAREFEVVIDFAHTPDGLENILKVLRNTTKGRLITVFGCGGDRDVTKRSIMGEISGKLSDFSILTSDNPRWENPDRIIDDIEEGIVKTGGSYIRVPDRRKALETALKMAKKDDMVLLAGKGHELWQVVNSEKITFNEREIIKEILKDNESNQDK